LLEVFGMGSVARQEVSFTQFLVDMVDSVIIEFTRVLAGRRLARQLELVSPVATVAKPVIDVLSLLPKSYYGVVLDLAVDVTGVANRRSGGYGLMRSAGLGYFAGGGDDSACKSLQQNLLDDAAFCDNDGAFFPLAILNPLNQHEFGKTVRLGGDGFVNPLMDRTTNPHAMQHTSFQLSDLMEPTKMLCKVDTVLKAMKGDVEVHEDPSLAPIHITEEDLMLNGEYENLVEVRKNDRKVIMKDLREEEKHFVEMMMVYDRVMRLREEEVAEGMYKITRKATSQDKFNDYCTELNRKEVEKILKSVNITVESTTASNIDDYLETYDVDGSGDSDYDPVVDVRKSNDMPEKDDNEVDIEEVARIGDKSLLSEKLDVEQGKEVEGVQSLINTFKIEANGKIENVMKIDSKKPQTVLLIQFDSQEYRDAVLKASRSPGARSSSNVRFRRPKVKDLKHVVSLVKRH